MMVHEWECSTVDDFKHRWSARVGLECVMCPFCGSLNRKLAAKKEWEKSALFKWAKRRTGNDK